MNEILAKVVNIQENKDLHKVDFSSVVGGLSLVSLALNLKVGDEVTVGFKSTAVAISKDRNSLLSYSNQIDTKILEIQKGEILSKIIGHLNSQKLTSIITTDSLNRLGLKVGESATFLVKSTDVFVVRYD